MVFKNLCIVVLLTKVASALEGFKTALFTKAYQIVRTFLASTCMNKKLSSCPHFYLSSLEFSGISCPAAGLVVEQLPIIRGRALRNGGQQTHGRRSAADRQKRAPAVFCSQRGGTCWLPVQNVSCIKKSLHGNSIHEKIIFMQRNFSIFMHKNEIFMHENISSYENETFSPGMLYLPQKCSWVVGLYRT